MHNLIQWLEYNADSEKYGPAESALSSLTQLRRRSLIYAAELSRLGVKAGDGVGLFFHSGPDYAALLFAIWRLNAVVVPLAPRNLQQSRHVHQHGLRGDSCRLRILIHNAATHEEVLLQWLRWSYVTVYSLEHFENLQPSGLLHAIPNSADSIRADDLAVYKIPQQTIAESAAIPLTHADLLQLLCATQKQAPPFPPLTAPTLAELVALVSLPFPATVLMSA